MLCNIWSAIRVIWLLNSITGLRLRADGAARRGAVRCGAARRGAVLGWCEHAHHHGGLLRGMDPGAGTGEYWPRA